VNDRFLIYAGVFCRSTAVGSLKVFLGLYLLAAGLGENRLGIVVSAGLIGVMAGTLAASFLADRLGRRRSLVVLIVLNLSGAVALMFLSEFWPILLVSTLGMINGMGKERGAALAIESAALPQTGSDEERTLIFARYNVVIDLGHALGAILGTMPQWLETRQIGIERYSYALAAYAGLMALAAIAALCLSKRVELETPAASARLSPESRNVVLGFAALSWLDSFGSGFIAGSILSVWLASRFGVGELAIGLLYLGGSMSNAVSHYGAAWLSRKIGLLNTMVFTHIPSSGFLIAMAFVPEFWMAAALFLARELLVEMDVPTRQSYLTGIVRPQERTAAQGLVGVARNLGWAISPAIAGALLEAFRGALAFGSPLVLCGAFKIVYDLALWRSFRTLKPPEERG
jgi:MFS family permease